MDLLERINDTLPDACWGNEEDVAERMEALADRHAVGFLDWINAECDHDSAYSGAVFQGIRYRSEDLISIYKRRYPDGY